ncbi:MAG: protein phosphatase 2C domain-containing protein [bacterium]
MDSINNKNNLKIVYAGKSDVGLVRSENQDSFGKFPEDNNDMYSEKGVLFIVADGIGGHSNGKEASQLAIDTVKEKYFSSSVDGSPGSLRLAIEEANTNIFSKSSTDSQFKRMGTTCSTLVIRNENGFVGHVGDSKVFHISKNNITQLTRDHTLVGEMMKHGIISNKEAKQHPDRSTLLRALGGEPAVDVDIIENFSVQAGDRFVLCTDGLANVNSAEIKEIACSLSPYDACDKLIGLAKDRGGKDNVTVLVIEIAVENIKRQTAPPFTKKIFPSKIFIGAILFIMAVIFFSLINVKDKSPVETLPIVHDSNNDLNDEANVEGNSNSNVEQLFQSGVKFQKQGKLNSAVKKYQAVLKISPTHLGAIDGMAQIAEEYKRLGKKLQSNRKYSEAILMYEKSTNLNPTDTEIPDLINRCKFLQNKNVAE